MPLSSHYFPSLTGLRWLAALLVYFHHYPIPLPDFILGNDENSLAIDSLKALQPKSPLTQAALEAPDSKMQLLANYLTCIYSELHIGVQIFFVLSGFLITLRYFENFRTSPNWFRNYIQNRFARVYPMLFILTTYTILIVPALNNPTGGINSMDWLDWAMNVTLLKGFSDKLKFWGISQSWTLTVEECFYLLAPFLIFIWRKKIYLAGASVCIFGYLVGYILLQAGEAANFIGFFKPANFVINYTFFGRIFEFVAGATLAKLMIKNKWVRPPPKRSWNQNIPLYAGITTLMSCVLFLAYIGLQGKPARESLWLLSITHFISPLGCVLLIYGLINTSGLTTKLMSLKPIEYLGKASYSFYLVHFSNPIATHIKYISDKFSILVLGNENFYFIYTIQLTLIILASCVLYQYVEEPLKRKLSRKHK